MKHYFTKFLLTGLLAVIRFTLLAQPPANDECSNAITITTTPFGTSCTNATAASTVNATASAPGPSCNGSANDDIWYSFTAGSQSVIIRISNAVLVPSGNASIGYALYSGNCGSLNQVTCEANFASGNGYRIINGLSAGTQYYVRFWTTSSTNPANFNFCIQDAPAPPVNDDCSNAIAISTQPFGTSCSASVTANTSGATHSTPDPACGLTDSNDDIWYSFTANSTSVMLRYTNAVITTTGSGAQLGYTLYENNCAGAVVSCEQWFGFTNGLQIINGLTAGVTYYLRLFSRNANNYISFAFCVQDVPAPPVNDECTNAITIIPEAYGGNCASSIAATTSGATPSSPGASCGAGDSNDDIWYTFTATDSSIIVRFNNAIQTSSNNPAIIGYAMYEGSCAATTATFSCDANIGISNGSVVINGLTIGNTYYLRLFSNGAGNYASFNFCVQNLPPPPANDECSGAIPIALTPFGATCSNKVLADTYGATQSSPHPSCTDNINDDDIWYSFQATTATINLRVFNAAKFSTGGGTVIGVALYHGSCPTSGSTLLCNNIVSAGNGLSIINGLIPGNTYYLRFWEFTISDYASFEFCVQEVPPVINDDCSAAIPITTQPVGTNCNATYSAITIGATPSATAPACIGNFNDDDIWYTFSANTSALRINFSNLLTATSLSGSANLGYALYDAACPGPASIPISCNANIGNQSGSILVGGLVPGRQYYLQFFTYGAGHYGTFDFCLVDVDVPLNDECINAIPLSVSNGFCTHPITGTLENSTEIAGLGPSACASTITGNDVWYRVTIPATGNVIIQTSAVNNQVSDLAMEAYSGTCGTLSLIDCNDNGNPAPYPSGDHPRISLTGRTPGETIYLRVMAKLAFYLGPYAICAWDSTATVPVSAGGNCITATTVTINAVNGNQYMWVPVMDGSGNIIAELYPNGNVLGTVNSSLFTNNTGIVRNVNGHYYLDRNLTIEPSGTGAAKVRIYFTAAEWNALLAADPTITGLDGIKINKVSTGCQPAFSGIVTGISQDTAAAYGTDFYIEFNTTSFSSFFIDGLSGALPLEFLSFTAQKIATGNRLEWIVSKDENIRYFEIERSKDGQSFTSIATKQQAAFDKETNQSWHYSYTDKAVTGDLLYYRIKMTDVNGKVLYSAIVIMNTPVTELVVKAYPNPVSRQLQIAVNLPAPGIRIQLMNAAGRLIKQRNYNSLQNGTMQLDLRDIPGGLYLLLVTETTTGKTHQLKVIKQ